MHDFNTGFHFTEQSGKRKKKPESSKVREGESEDGTKTKQTSRRRKNVGFWEGFRPEQVSAFLCRLDPEGSHHISEHEGAHCPSVTEIQIISGFSQETPHDDKDLNPLQTLK